MTRHPLLEAKDTSIQKTCVDTLYKQTSMLAMGWLAQVICCIAGYLEFGNNAYLYLFGVMTLILAGRYGDSRFFIHRMGNKDATEISIDTLNYWERRYVFGSCSTGLGLAIITAFTMATNPVSVTSLMGLGVVMGHLPSVVGKNFPLKHNIDYLVTVLCVPIFAGLTLNSAISMRNEGLTVQNALLGVTGMMMILAILITRKMAGEVRQILLDKLTNLHEAENVRKLLQAALYYMPSGMLMVNDDNQITLMNQKAARMFGVRGEDVEKLIEARVPLFRMVTMAVHSGLLPRRDAHEIRDQLREMMLSDQPSHVVRMGRHFIQMTINNLPKRNKGDLHSITGSVLTCEDVTKRVESENESKHNANYDLLSGLPNRRYMYESLSNAVANMADHELIALAVIDIDKFKSINDNHGHKMGDEAIRAVARELQSFKHDNVFCARLGGDEFVIAFHSLQDDRRIDELYDMIFRSLGKSYQITVDVENGRNDGLGLSRKSIDINCSGGVIVRSKANFNVEDALNKADIALRTSKKERGTGWHLFDEHMEAEHHSYERLREDFRTSLTNGEITVAYQPMFTPDGKQIVACEALARWNHKELGFVSPAKFVPLAEQNGYINDLTRHILRQSCVDCASWPDQTVSVSVNLSAIDLSNREIVRDIEGALRAAKLDGSRLQIEVTESVFLKDREEAASILQHLRRLGIKVAIDDFGTGYSSLAYLKDLPLDKLKIDKHFVNEVAVQDSAAHFFDTMVVFSKALGFDVVVEGVETQDQLDVITRSNVDLIQGYLFGKPMSGADVHQTIDALTKPENRLQSNVIALKRKVARG
jgi:diguanylate cyclase (GGDEF)-like protein